ncbi:hypothetical protein FNF27_04859 [Cafeteria roenbergensis]|uniref:Uncharacterized protein n=1 Tax=Cafeteria roenbergensis TaxID=33653 RepID=A0A5A8CGM7_CAFRO|nr:hypothetical protein FNF29_05318 [Cafeteria roenbergensis]KAA0151948.1 hypothetical protein FNF31_06709 [Cafeteria roenbergensis]KAA0166930.1 hypothetical protein FNF28_03002 [Cafeteria roenbergensis]KAA0173709.1 hypothetical protein FNF27_04859 [Cafeteria roenbergensis]|eukprot:KAA0150306.1 hypothetical protein FNF29_05318 [Cafeteria roenbergensis]
MANADNDGAAERAVKDYASLEGRVSKEALERAGMKRVDTSKRFMGPKDASRTNPTPWRCHDRLSDVSKVVTAPFSHSWAEHSRSWGLLIACARSEHGAEPQDARMGAEAPLPKVNQYRRTDMPAAGAAAPGKQEER